MHGALGIDVPQLQRQRRHIACACLDWSERHAHPGGARGAAILQPALRQGWAEREFDSRALRRTPSGERRAAPAGRLFQPLNDAGILYLGSNYREKNALLLLFSFII